MTRREGWVNILSEADSIDLTKERAILNLRTEYFPALPDLRNHDNGFI